MRVLKAMASKLADRYDTAEELADDLRRFLQREPTQARQSASLQRLRSGPAVRRIAVILALIATISLGAWGSRLAWQAYREQQD